MSAVPGTAFGRPGIARSRLHREMFAEIVAAYILVLNNLVRAA